MRLALAGVPLIVVALWSGSARSQDRVLEGEALPEKLVLLNKAALEDIDNLEWDSAKKKLLDALVLGKKGGLDNHPIMARTYVHLGAVYINGFKNREKALQSFRRALEIDPGIRLSRSMATAEVNDVFETARGRSWPTNRRRVRDDGFTEPDLPVRVTALDCFFAEHTRVDQAVSARCALAPNLPVTNVFLLYREPAKGGFTEVEMKRTPKGWFQGRIPERVIYGPSVQLYFEGRNATGKPIVRNGEEPIPNLILIVKR